MEDDTDSPSTGGAVGDDTTERSDPTGDDRAADADHGTNAVDGPTDTPPSRGEPGSSGGESPGPTDEGPDDREVVVPMRLYKTVTVFSTLLAVVAILVGFVLLDRGTQRATAGPDEVSLPIVALGLAFIVGGSAVYAFSTRFRAEGMGKPKDDTGEQSNNG